MPAISRYVRLGTTSGSTECAQASPRTGLHVFFVHICLYRWNRAALSSVSFVAWLRATCLCNSTQGCLLHGMSRVAQLGAKHRPRCALQQRTMFGHVNTDTIIHLMDLHAAKGSVHDSVKIQVRHESWTARKEITVRWTSLECASGDNVQQAYAQLRLLCSWSLLSRSRLSSRPSADSLSYLQTGLAA